MIDKTVTDMGAALDGLTDGMTVLISGFGDAGMPHQLCDAMVETGATDLTIVSNNAGTGRTGIAAVMAAGRVRRVVCSYPRTRGSVVFEELYADRRIELELVPQGTLSERMRCAGAGLGGFWSPVGVGTALAAGKEVREIDGRTYVLEAPLPGDFALIGAHHGDRWGNLTYHKTARNFGPVMATAARTVVAQVRRIVDLGAIDPEDVITPGIFVDRVIAVGEGC